MHGNLTNISGSTLNGTASFGTSYLKRFSEDFVERHWHLLLFMMLEISIVAGLYVYHIMWVKVQKQRAKTSEVMLLTEECSLELLRRFLPSAKVEKYRFRGMTKKKASASVAFEDISLELASGERILQGVTGEFRAGRMCAIMGPSGAGKTSLMNVLCGKASYGRATGVVRFNGVEGEYEDYKTVMGFVPQDDVVHEGLTVGEQIHFSAELRNPRDSEPQRRKLISEDVLNVMQLGNIQNSVVGGLEQRGISGGQRKRVSIGLELAADPTMLFLDEPTSGLDAAASLAIVHSLKRMAQLGMTSVMVVHQPRYSLYCLFDDVLLLGKGGRTVYLGPALGAKPYFQRLGFEVPTSENPADWFMDLISGEVPNQKIPQFVPEMLFQLWEANKHSVERSARKREQAMLQVDEWQQLVMKLDEEWPRISYKNAPSVLDPGRKGVLRKEDVLRLIRPHHDEVEEEILSQAAGQLLSRIAGPSALVASKAEVRDFLAGLQGVVAEDKAVNKQMSDGIGPKSSQRSICSSISSGTSTSRDHDAMSIGGASCRTGRSLLRKQPSVIPESEEELSTRRTTDDRPPQQRKVLRSEARHRMPIPPSLEAAPEEAKQADLDSQNLEEEATGGLEFDRRPSLPSPKVVQATLGDVASSVFGDEELCSDVPDNPEDDTLQSSEIRTREGKPRSPSEVVNSKMVLESLPPVPSTSKPAVPKLKLNQGTDESKVKSKGRPKEFDIVLEEVMGSDLGAELVARSDNLTLKVKSVRSDGRVSDWNQANPELPVKKHDTILEVSGVRDNAEAMLEASKAGGRLELKVRTRDHRPHGHGSASSVAHSVGGISSATGATLLGRVVNVDERKVSTLSTNLHASNVPLQSELELRPGSSAPSQPDLALDTGAGALHFMNFDAKSASVGQPGTLSCPKSRKSDHASLSSYCPSTQSEVEISGPSDETMQKLSPRTRSVWEKQVMTSERSQKESARKTNRQERAGRHVELSSVVTRSEYEVCQPSDADNCSEVVLDVDDPDTFTRSTRRTKTVNSLMTTRSCASIGRLQSIASSSKPPGFGKQLILLIHRSSIQWWRGNWQRAIFLAVISGSAMVLAVMDTFVQKEAEWQVLPILNLHTTLSLLSAVFCLNVFSTDRPVFWRERESGLSVAAFYISKVLVNTIDLLLQCFLLAAIYYMIAQPQVTFSIYFMPFLLVSFASAGLGYTISAFLPPQHGPFVTAICIFVSCGLLGHPLRIETMADGAALEVAMDILSITRWSVGLYFTDYLKDFDRQSVAADHDALEAIASIEHIYMDPSLVADRLLGIRAEVVFLLGMAIFWHLVGYLRLTLGNRFRGHRRSSPWKQRYHQAVAFLRDTTVRILGDERVEELEMAAASIFKRLRIV